MKCTPLALKLYQPAPFVRGADSCRRPTISTRSSTLSRTVRQGNVNLSVHPRANTSGLDGGNGTQLEK